MKKFLQLLKWNKLTNNNNKGVKERNFVANKTDCFQVIHTDVVNTSAPLTGPGRLHFPRKKLGRNVCSWKSFILLKPENVQVENTKNK